MVSIRTVARMVLRDADVVLREDEHVVPQAGFEVRLGLGQVEVGALAEVEQPPGVVEEVQPEVDQGAGHFLAVDLEVALVQVPAARPHDDGGEFGGVLEGVRLAGDRSVKSMFPV